MEEIIIERRSTNLFNQVLWYVIGVIELLLLFRFALKLFGANPAAGFTNFIYVASSIFTSPFQAVFNPTYAQGAIFEWTTLLAMFVYWLIGILIENLFVTVKEERIIR